MVDNLGVATHIDVTSDQLGGILSLLIDHWGTEITVFHNVRYVSFDFNLLVIWGDHVWHTVCRPYEGIPFFHALLAHRQY